MNRLPDLSRRRLLKFGGAIGVAASLDTVARADVPKPLGTQVPGFYRMRLGEAEVTLVSDGVLAASPPTMLFPHTPLAEIEAGLAAAHLPADPITLQFNAMVVNTGQNLVLIDTGCGPKYVPSAGRLAAALEAAGFTPEAIDTVIISHAHPDHLWGAVGDDWAAVRFPNAAIHLGEVEHGFWADPGLSARMPEAFRPMVEGTQAVLKLVSPHLQLVQPGKEIVPGITSIATPGHTPGHLSFRLASGSDQLVFSADVAHHWSLQLANPSWQFAFDNDPLLAVETRTKTLDMLATDGVLVAAYHFPWPGIGYVERAGDTYRWVPAPWQWL